MSETFAGLHDLETALHRDSNPKISLGVGFRTPAGLHPLETSMRGDLLAIQQRSKSLALTVPVADTWPGPVLVVDLKGEIEPLLFREPGRKRDVRHITIDAPIEETGKRFFPYHALQAIEWTELRFAALDLDAYFNAICKGNDKKLTVWAKRASSLLTGVALFLFITKTQPTLTWKDILAAIEPKANYKSMFFVAQKILATTANPTRRADIEEIIRRFAVHLDRLESERGIGQAEVSAIAQEAAVIESSILCDFEIDHGCPSSPPATFIRVNPETLYSARPHLDAILRQSVRQLTAQGYQEPILVVLPDAELYGTLLSIESLLLAENVACFFTFSSLTAMHETYPRKDAIESNASIIFVGSSMDSATTEWASKLTAVGNDERGRGRLLSPSQIRALPPHQLLMVLPGAMPALVEKLPLSC